MLSFKVVDNSVDNPKQRMWISPKGIVEDLRKEYSSKGPEDEEPEQPEAA